MKTYLIWRAGRGGGLPSSLTRKIYPMLILHPRAPLLTWRESEVEEYNNELKYKNMLQCCREECLPEGKFAGHLTHFLLIISLWHNLVHWTIFHWEYGPWCEGATSFLCHWTTTCLPCSDFCSRIWEAQTYGSLIMAQFLLPQQNLELN